MQVIPDEVIKNIVFTSANMEQVRVAVQRIKDQERLIGYLQENSEQKTWLEGNLWT